MRILLVEDNSRLRVLLTEVLRGAGYRVDAFASVTDLLNAAKAICSDLLVTDLERPDGDGWTQFVFCELSTTLCRFSS
jgi:DNA-binding response OmpR family regulator